VSGKKSRLARTDREGNEEVLVNLALLGVKRGFPRGLDLDSWPWVVFKASEGLPQGAFFRRTLRAEVPSSPHK